MSTNNNLQLLAELKNVDLDKFKSIIGSSLICDGKLGLTIYPDATIMSIVAAGNNSFFKQWRHNLLNEAICESMHMSVQQHIKLFMVDGNKFKSKVLAFQSATILIYGDVLRGANGDEYVAKFLEVVTPAVKLNVICSPLQLGFTTFTTEQYKSVFENTANVRQLSLTSDQFKTLNYYGGLNTAGDNSDNTITLRTTQKGLVANDSSFEHVVDPTYQFDLKPIKMYKALLRFIDDGHMYDVKISTTATGRDVMTIKSVDSDLIMAAALMEDINDYVSNDSDIDF